ncbi:ATP-binding protein [Methylophilaceae bacterium]|nr:ATP-binding protein [Methylophilaceae bacterium]
MKIKLKYLITTAAFIGIALLILLAKAISNSDLISSDSFRILLGLNIFFICSLIGLIGVQIFQLLQSVKKEITGSRLTLRLVLSFALMGIVPVLIVYLVSVNFLTKSIESWFDVKVESALEGGLTLGQKTIDILMSDIELKGKSIAYSIGNAEVDQRNNILTDLRAKFGIQDAVIFDQDSLIIEVSSERNNLIPPIPNIEDLERGSRDFFGKIEETNGEQIFLKAFIPIISKNVMSKKLILQLTQPIPPSIANLALSVESVYDEYQQLTYSRNSLKIIYILTLTLVLLLALLSSVAASFVISRKFSSPLAMLADATREISKGNYKKIISEQGKDELGILIKSFNSMTSQLEQATKNSEKDRERLELARTFLETILAHLTTGVIVIDEKKIIRLNNVSASKMLQNKESKMNNKLMSAVISDNKGFEPLYEFISTYIVDNKENKKEVSQEFKLYKDNRERTIMLQITPLNDKKNKTYVLVIDDISEVTEAQRHSAWGEIARRLAHEIKNPLTPIQLSAERIQHKFGNKLNKEDAIILERSTNTIVNQVNSLKIMVNEFAEYARPPKIQKDQIRIDNLIDEVIELYEIDKIIDVKKDKNIPIIYADQNKIRQVIINLIENSKDALKDSKKPKIRIFIKKKVNEVELILEDNGIGISDEIIGRIFEPYVTSKKTGTGLGLAIVHKIIEEHNGDIKIERIRNSGTRVIIKLKSGRR